MTFKERRNAAKCGTMGGVSKHWRMKEAACDECKAADRSYRLQRRNATGNKPHEIIPYADKVRAKTIYAYKYNTPCADCKQYLDPEQLDLDHYKKSRKESHAEYGRPIYRLPWKEFWEEMDVVQVVCANCHRLRTARRAGRKIVRGLSSD